MTAAQTSPQSSQEQRHAIFQRSHLAEVLIPESARKKSATAQVALLCDRLIELRFPPVNFSQMEQLEDL